MSGGPGSTHWQHSHLYSTQTRLLARIHTCTQVIPAQALPPWCRGVQRLEELGRRREPVVGAGGRMASAQLPALLERIKAASSELEKVSKLAASRAAAWVWAWVWEVGLQIVQARRGGFAPTAKGAALFLALHYLLTGASCGRAQACPGTASGGRAGRWRQHDRRRGGRAAGLGVVAPGACPCPAGAGDVAAAERLWSSRGFRSLPGACVR